MVAELMLRGNADDVSIILRRAEIQTRKTGGRQLVVMIAVSIKLIDFAAPPPAITGVIPGMNAWSNRKRTGGLHSSRAGRMIAGRGGSHMLGTSPAKGMALSLGNIRRQQDCEQIRAGEPVVPQHAIDPLLGCGRRLGLRFVRQIIVLEESAPARASSPVDRSKLVHVLPQFYIVV